MATNNSTALKNYLASEGPLLSAFNPSVTGDLTAGSNIVTNVADTSRVSVGACINGANIPAGATVTAKTADTITLSQPATATAAGVKLTLGATLAIYAGNKPQKADDSKPSTAVEVLRYTNILWDTVPVDGYLPLQSAIRATATANGTVAWGRLLDPSDFSPESSSTAKFRKDGECAQSGKDINFQKGTSVTAGEEVKISVFNLGIK